MFLKQWIFITFLHCLFNNSWNFLCLHYPPKQIIVQISRVLEMYLVSIAWPQLNAPGWEAATGAPAWPQWPWLGCGGSGPRLGCLATMGACRCDCIWASAPTARCTLSAEDPGTGKGTWNGQSQAPRFLEAESVVRSRSHCFLRHLQGSFGPESILIWNEAFNGKYAEHGITCPAVQGRRAVPAERSLPLLLSTSLWLPVTAALGGKASLGALPSQNAHLEGLRFFFFFFFF